MPEPSPRDGGLNDKSHPTPILATTRLTSNLDEIVLSAGVEGSMWRKASLADIGEIPGNPGVYCFVLPESALPIDRAVILHGRTFGPKGARRQLQIRFHYTASAFTEGADMVIYVGKAVNLRGRLKAHLSVDIRATTNQVLRGLVGKPHTHITREALTKSRKHLKEHGVVYYYEHSHADERNDHHTRDDVGETFVAERDLLELKLIAKYAPPFNLKAER
jgi:hypothetical protein